MHLDEFPIDYNLNVPGDRFLTGLAFMFARQRYDCADSLIGASFGGTVLGSLARSLFIDGLRWLWIADRPERRRALLGDLLAERNRLCVLLEETGCTCPILPRWLMPLPDVADLTGQSMTWLDAPTMPGDDELLNDFFARADAVAATPSVGVKDTLLLEQVRPLFDMAGLRGAMMVLAHAGHGNHLGLQSSLTEDGAPGHDLRADHEALFMHVAAVGTTTTLLGTAYTVPEAWPVDVDRERFLSRAIELTADVAAAAAPIHGLGAARRPVQHQGKTSSDPQGRRPVLVRPQAVLSADDLLPDVNSADGVVEAAEKYFQTARSLLIKPWDFGQPPLHALLGFGGGHSNLQAVMSTYDQPGSAVIAVFAARMLLEEAARLRWRFSVTEKDFEERAKQYFDEFRARQKKTINTLMGSGIRKADAERIFALPSTVQVVTPNEIAKNRTPLPWISSMLRDMGAPFPEPGWLEVAYSLLSQVTHSTPIGHLHAVRVHGGVWCGNELSTEMLGLAIDTACLGSAHLIGTSAMILTKGSEETARFQQTLLREAVAVHNAARMVHGLD